MYEDQQKWVAYEEQLQFLKHHGPYADLLESMVNTMQQWLNNGGISLICPGMGSWVNVLNSAKSSQPLAIGTQLDGLSVARNAMKEKSPEFAVHFNQNPKRMARRENRTAGATLAVPLLIRDQVMGIALVYDENPLLFKDSTKHKFINTVRLAALNFPDRSQDHPGSPFSHSSGAIIPDIWERTIDTEIKRLQNKITSYHTWISLLSLPELSHIRTQLRLEDLKLMQRDLVHALNPGHFEVPGFLGFHSDYRYVAIVQSDDPEAQKFWEDRINEQFSGSFELTNGKQIRTGLRINSLILNETYSDSYEVMKALKKKKVH